MRTGISTVQKNLWRSLFVAAAAALTSSCIIAPSEAHIRPDMEAIRAEAAAKMAQQQAYWDNKLAETRALYAARLEEAKLEGNIKVVAAQCSAAAKDGKVILHQFLCAQDLRDIYRANRDNKNLPEDYIPFLAAGQVVDTVKGRSLCFMKNGYFSCFAAPAGAHLPAIDNPPIVDAAKAPFKVLPDNWYGLDQNAPTAFITVSTKFGTTPPTEIDAFLNPVVQNTAEQNLQNLATAMTARVKDFWSSATEAAQKVGSAVVSAVKAPAAKAPVAAASAPVIDKAATTKAEPELVVLPLKADISDWAADVWPSTQMSCGPFWAARERDTWAINFANGNEQPQQSAQKKATTVHKTTIAAVKESPKLPQIKEVVGGLIVAIGALAIMNKLEDEFRLYLKNKKRANNKPKTIKKSVLSKIGGHIWAALPGAAVGYGVSAATKAAVGYTAVQLGATTLLGTVSGFASAFVLPVLAAASLGALAGGLSNMARVALFDKNKGEDWASKSFAKGMIFGAIGGGLMTTAIEIFDAVVPADAMQAVVDPVKKLLAPVSDYFAPHAQAQATAAVPAPVAAPVVHPAVTVPHDIAATVPAAPHVENVKALLSDSQMHALPKWVQQIDVTRSPENMATFCKEASYHLMNDDTHNKAAVELGRSLVEKGFAVAKEADLHTHAAKMLQADMSFISHVKRVGSVAHQAVKAAYTPA